MTRESAWDGVFAIFSDLAGMLGYSPIHGKIIGALVSEEGPVSLQDIAHKTGYSLGMISISLELLDVMGIAKRIKKPRDRKLYVQLEGDLLTIMKKAVMTRVGKGVEASLKNLEERKDDAERLQGKEKEKLLKTIGILESEIKRLKNYVNLLSGIGLP